MNYWNQETPKTVVPALVQQSPGQRPSTLGQRTFGQRITGRGQGAGRGPATGRGQGRRKTSSGTKFSRFALVKPGSKPIKSKKIKKSLQYLMLLKKFNNVIDFKNIKLLRAFLTKFGKIRPRRKTRLPIQKQRLVAKAIRKARAFQLIPFTFDVIV